MRKYLIAHDLGTSGDKASLFSTDGTLICSCTVSYDVHYFGSNCAEQNPLDWWHAFCHSTQEIMQGISPDDVLAVSFSAQMQCCLIVDEHGTPLRPAIIWADQRALEEEQLLRQRIGADRMYELTGHRVSASYSLEKLMWIKKHEKQNYDRTFKMLQVKDYIIHRLTGAFVTDYSDASGTNAFDLKKLDWSDEILRAAEIEREKFPDAYPSTHCVGTIQQETASQLGLSSRTLVVCGGGDGPCSAVGAGCTQPDELFLTFGTSAWIGGTTNEVFTDPKQILFCFAHVIPGKYMPCGTTQSAGSVYSYLRRTLLASEADAAAAHGKNPYEAINRMIAASPAGAKGLLFLPYLLGERSPRWNAKTSGAFLNIKMEHQKEDYARAVIEGIAMNLDLILDCYREKLPVKEMILTGGGAKGDIVAQILADVLNVTLCRPNHVEEATSIAAALIAGIGCGVFTDFSEVTRFLQTDRTTIPAPQPVYGRQKELFDLAYQQLLPFYDRAYEP